MKAKGGDLALDKGGTDGKQRLRSAQWFDNPDNPGMTALYLERYLNFGLTPRGAALGQADHRHRPDRLRPVALQPPSPRARQARARRHRRGRRHCRSNSRSIRSRRPASARPRRSTATSPISAWSRSLYGYPLDGVVLTTGCDKTTPACLMAAATVNIPAIVLSGGPMLNGWYKGERTGSGTIVWEARAELAAGKIDYERVHGDRRLLGAVDRPLQHHGHGLDDERAGRSARHVAARLRRHPRAAIASAARSPTRPAGASSRWCGRI